MVNFMEIQEVMSTIEQRLNKAKIEKEKLESTIKKYESSDDLLDSLPQVYYKKDGAMYIYFSGGKSLYIKSKERDKVLEQVKKRQEYERILALHKTLTSFINKVEFTLRELAFEDISDRL